MKSLTWFVLGVAGGFAAAHAAIRDPRGHELLAVVDARIAEFTDRMGDAYRAQEARIAGTDETGVELTAEPGAERVLEQGDADAPPRPEGEASAPEDTREPAPSHD